jgi:hypothetical protein
MVYRTRKGKGGEFCRLPINVPDDAATGTGGIRLKTKKTAISRIENHAEDIKLSTLEKVAVALGKRLQVKIASW